MKMPWFSKIILTLSLATLAVAIAIPAVDNAEDKGMAPELLAKTIEAYGKDIKINNNVISFSYNNVSLYCIWDQKANRMRLISPIAKADKVPQDVLILALQANYHTLLDARYAIGDDIVYSAFIHPLSPLTAEELRSAIRQVATAAATFGNEYTSGELVFPGNRSKPEKTEKPEAWN